MKILCVGAAGQISRESLKDLIEFGDFDQITIGDVNEEAARQVREEVGDQRVDFVHLDITDTAGSVEVMRGYDVVMAGLPIALDTLLVDAVMAAGVSGLDVTGMGQTYFDYDTRARQAGIIFVPGVGMTPGTTNILAKYAADQM
ncbi:MAG: saccharopine dehydrogenase NADP-binding domain-containing protein, partial [Deltaproteobacteria bacterium]|nr:saccharopine dehydrogenase NADP-binding domain-containing protein [Deltaproteobacteria bacterium]